MPFGIGFFATGADSDYRLIESQILSSNTGTITFTNIPQGFRHLQLRGVAMASTNGMTINLQFNGNAAFSYSSHALLAEGSAVFSGAATNSDNILLFGRAVGVRTDSPTPFVMDILDFSATTKNKTVRTLAATIAPSGQDEISLSSGLWSNTAAVTSLSLYSFANFASGSRFSLYGIRG